MVLDVPAVAGPHNGAGKTDFAIIRSVQRSPAGHTYEVRVHYERGMKQRLTLAGSVAVITFLVFLPALRNGFVTWDDGMYVYENPFIHSLDLHLLKRAVLDFYASNWHPLTLISHAVDYAVWGLNPAGHHLTNTILHAMNTFLVVLLAVRLVEAGKPASGQADKLRVSHDSPPSGKSGTLPNDSRKPAGRTGGRPDFPHAVDYSLLTTHYSPLIVAGFTGLLFGLHPLRVESVAWVSERKDLLCALFFLLSIMMYVRYAAHPSQRAHRIGHGARGMGHRVFDTLRFALCALRYRSMLYALCFFILALLSKPMAVTLPAVLLLLDYHPLQRIHSLSALKTVFFEKLPFFLLSLGSAVITILAQSSGKAIVPLEHTPLATRLMVGIKALTDYLWKMLLPFDLSPFYPYPHAVSLFSPSYLVPAFVVAGVTGVVIGMARTQRALLVAWGYYVVTLLPVLGIIQVGSHAMADRYTYLPCLGPFFVAGLGAAWVFGRAAARTERSTGMKAAGAIMAAMLLVILSYHTIQQTRIWKDSVTLWSYVIDREHDKVLLAYYNRGLVYGKSGLLGEALRDFDEAISINPNFGMAYNNRGAVYYLLGLHDRALPDFTRAIELERDNAEAYINRAYVYLKRGEKGLAVNDLRQGCNLGNEVGCKTLASLLKK